MKSKTLAEKTRIDFPMIIENDRSEKRLVYLDHAATSQKPNSVIDSLNNYYFKQNANVHRGAHQLSAKATEAFENAREITSKFISARNAKEIVFTRNATEGINLVARSWGDQEIKEGDEILLSIMEHHSNIVPWQQLAKRKGCNLKYIGLTDSGTLDIEDLRKKINSKTKLISIVHVSNTLGCCNPIKEITKIAREKNILTLVDACQSLAHQEVSVDDLKVDFLVGSSHKLCGPTGIGFLWAREALLENMPPFLGGGEMIENVYLDDFSWASLPHKFEAGTPAIGEAIAMGKALEYLTQVGLKNIHSWEQKITKYLFERIKSIDGIKILGPAPETDKDRASLATFNIKGLHANDLAQLLDMNGVCIRSGHHCCQPLHRYLGIKASARASLNFTTTEEEIDFFIDKLKLNINFLKENS